MNERKRRKDGHEEGKNKGRKMEGEEGRKERKEEDKMDMRNK